MKKLFTTIATIAAAAVLTFSLVGCEKKDDKTIVVGASPTPHAQILEVIKDNLKEEGWKLEIRQFEDYITPNTALEDGSLDANYFQHTPYLNTFNADYDTNLVSAGLIHYEPFGVYGKNVTKEDLDRKSVV